MLSKIIFAPLLLLLNSSGGDCFQSPLPAASRTTTTTVLGISPGVASDYDRDDFVNDRHYRDRGEYAEDFRVRPTRGRGGRGPHMDVTTSNPQFMRTDRPGGGFRYGGGGASIRPDIQDLRGVGRMPMQDATWDRYRYNRDRPSRFRSSRRGSMPHFIADEREIGMPIDEPRRGVEEEMEQEEMEQEERMREEQEIRGVGRGESMREREWREIDERQARRGARLYSQEFQGGGFDRGMPMGDEYGGWGDYPYPGGRGRYEERYFGDREGGFTPRRGRYQRGFYEGGDMGFSRRDEFEDDFARDGPHMGRGRYNRRGGREFFGNDVGRFGDGDSERFYPGRSRGLYNGSIRDEPGNIGGPTQQDLFGRDSQYTSRQQSWTTGTSFDTI